MMTIIFFVLFFFALTFYLFRSPSAKQIEKREHEIIINEWRKKRRLEIPIWKWGLRKKLQSIVTITVGKNITDKLQTTERKAKNMDIRKAKSVEIFDVSENFIIRPFVFSRDFIRLTENWKSVIFMQWSMFNFQTNQSRLKGSKVEKNERFAK